MHGECSRMSFCFAGGFLARSRNVCEAPARWHHRPPRDSPGGVMWRPRVTTERPGHDLLPLRQRGASKRSEAVSLSERRRPAALTRQLVCYTCEQREETVLEEYFLKKLKDTEEVIGSVNRTPAEPSREKSENVFYRREKLEKDSDVTDAVAVSSRGREPRSKKKKKCNDCSLCPFSLPKRGGASVRPTQPVSKHGVKIFIVSQVKNSRVRCFYPTKWKKIMNTYKKLEIFNLYRCCCWFCCCESHWSLLEVIKYFMAQ